MAPSRRHDSEFDEDRLTTNHREEDFDRDRGGRRSPIHSSSFSKRDDDRRNRHRSERKGEDRQSPDESDSDERQKRMRQRPERGSGRRDSNRRSESPRRPRRRNERSSGSPRKRRHSGRYSSDGYSDSDGRQKDRKYKEEHGSRHRVKDNGRGSGRSRTHQAYDEDSDSRGRHEEGSKDQRSHYNDQKSRSPEPWLDRVGTTKEEKEEKKPQPPLQQMADAVAIKTGGIYIPPHRMAQMMRDVQDKSSEAYQRLSWDALRKSINGLVNKVNATNIKNIIPELISENLVRGRGLFCRSCMKSQMASPGFTDVFGALVAVVNTRFPEVGKLLLKRILLQFRRAFARNDKPQLLAAIKFLAHLINQQVVHEVIALELLTVLLVNPTDDTVEVAVGFIKECGALLQDLVPLGLHGVFERFRGILHEGEIDKRVQFLIEGLFAIRKAKFQGFPAIRAELDLVAQEDQFTHEMSFEDEIDPETNLDVFKSSPQFLEDETAYENLKKSILGDESSDDEAGFEKGSDIVDDDEFEEEDDEQMKIKDETETNLINLRRTIYLTIMSGVDFEEAGHKLLEIKLEPGQEMELCIMLLECCSQERTYLRYYGL